MKTVLFAFLGLFLLAACSKTPESETAKKVGEQPKQIVDKVTTDLNKAMQKETERQQSTEKKD